MVIEVVLSIALFAGFGGESMVTVTRLLDAPIIHPGLDASIGENIQGPSLIKVPEWVTSPLGKYYLYFADHKGQYIRLAYADDLLGPWQIHVPGSLQLADSFFLTKRPMVTDEQLQRMEVSFKARGGQISHDLINEITAPHIASPDVHVDHENRRIVMYYHGLEDVGAQVSRVATSGDGMHFEARPEVLGRTYLRVFGWQERTYGLAMPGQYYLADSPLSGFTAGPSFFNPNMRHAALYVRGSTMWVFWTQVGDVPEHIKVSTVDLSNDWSQWQESTGVEVLRPDKVWEGAQAPLEPSVRSTAYGTVNQLRDPAIYVEGDDVYLLYAVAGESGIAIAKVTFNE
jgi:hypothetical protein